MYFAFQTKQIGDRLYCTRVTTSNAKGLPATQQLIHCQTDAIQGFNFSDIPGEVIAELMVIRHTLMHCEQFEEYLKAEIRLDVSCGQVKKSLQGRAKTVELTLLGAALHMAMPNMAIKVDHKSSIGPEELLSKPVSTLKLSSLYVSTHIDTPTSLGNIRITATAFNQFVMYSFSEMLEPFRLLKDSITPALKRIQIPERFWRRKMRTQRGQAFTEYWTTDESPLVYVFRRHAGGASKTLITCYRKVDMSS